MSHAAPAYPERTDLESALREAGRAVREGRPGDPVVISAAALSSLVEILHAQDKRIEQLKNTQTKTGQR